MSGILDLKGIWDNPLTGEPYQNLYIDDKENPNSYVGYAKKWSKLPVYAKRNEFITNIMDYQVLLIESGTGSGKTVLIPKFALHSLNYNGNVAVTIPKQLIAEGNAIFAAKTLDVYVGKEVGYKYRGVDKTSYKTKLTFMTDGSLVGQILGGDYLLKKYNIVIIDEAHERNVQIDFLLYLLKQILLIRKDFKLIIMSATLPNKQLFIDYFPKSSFDFIYMFAGEKPNFPIEKKFSDIELSKKNFLYRMIDIVLNLLLNTDNGDILCFVTSGNEATRACLLLKKKISDEIEKKRKKLNYFCVELYAKIDEKTRLLAINEVKKSENGTKKRKVVFSTNVAESSLTVEGIIYVVESGLKITKEYDPKKAIDIQEVNMISQAEAKQRWGRTGRVGPGVCYCLYTKEQFNNMDKFPKSVIKKSDLTKDFLQFFRLPSIESVKDLIELLSELIEVPDMDYIESGVNNLRNLGIFDNDDYLYLNNFGMIVKDMATGIHPYTIKMIILGYILGIKYEIVEFANLMETSNNSFNTLFKPFVINKKEIKNEIENEKKIFDRNRKMLISSNGDLMSYYDVFNYYKDLLEADVDKWNDLDWVNDQIEDVFHINTDYLKKIFGLNNLLLDELDNIMKKYDFEIDLEIPDKIFELDVKNKILYCLFESYFQNVAIGMKIKNTYSYKNYFPKIKSTINIPKTTNFYAYTKKFYKTIIYTNITKINGKNKFGLINGIPDEIYKLTPSSKKISHSRS
jgi:pre-mRNA-splicing factor ATP-dependent RNA helicase DHX15/PRP43